MPKQAASKAAAAASRPAAWQAAATAALTPRSSRARPSAAAGVVRGPSEAGAEDAAAFVADDGLSGGLASIHAQEESHGSQ